MNQSELEAYLKRANLTARLADLENAAALDEAHAAAAKARAAREDADFRELVEFVRSMRARPRPATATPVATRQAEATMPVIHLPRGGPGRVERRMTSWYLPGGGDADR